MSRHVASFCAILRHATSCRVILRHFASCYIMSRQRHFSIINKYVTNNKILANLIEVSCVVQPRPSHKAVTDDEILPNRTAPKNREPVVTDSSATEFVLKNVS
jgi:hypothetical protein